MKKWLKCFYLCCFLFLSLFILTEASMSGGDSSRQSGVLAFLLDHGAKEATLIEPESLSLTGIERIYVGESTAPSLAFTPSNTSDTRATYSLPEKKGLLKLLDNGRIQALKAGQEKLLVQSVSHPEIQSSWTYSIEEKSISEIALSLSTPTTLIQGMTTRLCWSTDKPDAESKDVTFLSSDPSLVSIDSQGKCRCLNTGNVVLSCQSAADSSIAKSLSLTVVSGAFTPVTALDYQGPDSFYLGQMFPLQATFNPGASDQAIQVTADKDYLSYEDGVLSGKKVGTTSLTMTSQSNPDFSKTLTLTIKEVKATAITCSTFAVQYGIATQLSYALTPEVKALPVTYPEVTFASKDPSVATIDSQGRLLGKKKGQLVLVLAWKEDPSVQLETTVIITSMTSSSFEWLHYLIRKVLGHFMLFLLTGVFAVIVFELYFFSGKDGWSLTALVYGFALAASSELCQMTTIGRGPSWKDVGIDFGGFALGVLIVSAIYLIVKAKREKKRVVSQPLFVAK